MTELASIADSTSRYEAWLGSQVRLLSNDLERKHVRMESSAFAFFRATFYRWMERWKGLRGELTGAARVLSVGDIHIENFGSWRDAEGRLVWGVNDFDEAYALPWTHDLVRLATSFGAVGLRLGVRD